MKNPVIHRGFTLVELLVVMTIIAILIALTLPALNAAMEVARRNTCTNNLTQISRAMTQHVTEQGFFPSGGWGYWWVGEPDCGYGSQQPGGWLFSILDYMEQSNVRNQGLGLDGEARANAIRDRMKNPIPIINCPTRRTRNIYPTKDGEADKYMTQASDHSFVNLKGQNASAIQYVKQVLECIKGDYATNAGTFGHDVAGSGLPSMVNAHSYKYKENKTLREYSMNYLTDSTDSTGGLNGISFLFSEVTPDLVEDGLANTYMVGEKFLPTNMYIVDNNTNGADNESAYDGADNDNQRICSSGPGQDRKQDTAWTDPFGSAHKYSFNMAFCDGSVRRVNYNINTDIHRNLCNRRDGNKITDWSAVSDGND